MAVSKINKKSTCQIVTHDLGTATVNAGSSTDFVTSVAASLGDGWSVGGIAELVKSGGSNGHVVLSAWWVNNGILTVRLYNPTSSALSITAYVNVLFVK